MPADLKPSNIAAASSPITNEEEADYLRQFTRSPHPYLRHGPEVTEARHDGNHEHHTRGKSVLHAEERPDQQPSSTFQASLEVAGSSESGTEADDERPNFVRALPAPTLRPRKGLKGGERDEDALLTPSQLDDDEGREYFRRQREVDEKERNEEEDEKLFRRRVNEFARRSSEVALMGGIVLVVLYGRGVWAMARQWKVELLSHLLLTTLLILVYPVKLSIVDTRATYAKPWQRFRVPASFDPATVLYPPLLPVLIALTVSPLQPQIILPNIILGLASLPQRLFPRSSRFAGINVVHWLISILPLIASEYTKWPYSTSLACTYRLKAPLGLPSEVLVTLYPLHHALLQPLQYLTTTSLLISELHLLSVALINLLLFASTPQAVILKACLWIGGLSLFLAAERVLHWNVTLARVPRWKLRRPGHSAEERKSLVDAVTDIIQVQRVASAFRSTSPAVFSDADDDEPAATLKNLANGRPKLATSKTHAGGNRREADAEPQSAVEPRKVTAYGPYPDVTQLSTTPRRNTLPSRPTTANGREPSARGRKIGVLLWCLQLTPTQAQHRKWLYAAWVYAAIAVLVLGPVRIYVSRKALSGHEPVGWALSYLLGQVSILREIVTSSNLHEGAYWDWLPLARQPAWLGDLKLTLPPNIPAMRHALGEANIRLLLIGYWALVLLAGLLAVFSLTAYVEVDTRRKVFHGVMVAMLLPATFVDPCACALALALILAVFLLLEVIRAGQVPPLGNAIGRFVAPYVDGRDLRGPVVVSHIFLLIGCAVPLWFSLAATKRTGSEPWAGWELKDDQRDVGMIAGVVCVGMGDAAASLIGRRYGRHKWLWVGGKSLEGSAAFAAAVTVGLMFAKVWCAFGGWKDAASPSTLDYRRSGLVGLLILWSVSLVKAAFCACAASFMEAVLTGANDNVVVPVVLWLLVKGIRL